MNISNINSVKVEGIYACLPNIEIDNKAAGRELFGESIDNAIKGTGIEKRRICSENTTSYDLCLFAAETLLNDLNIYQEEIGGVIFVTFTPDNQMPNNATKIQADLNLSTDLAAFDINLACSGYPYGLWISAMMAKNLNKKVLLLDGDKQSYLTSPIDKSTLLLFGDAGSATIVAPDAGAAESLFYFYTDGTRRDALIINEGGARNMFNPSSLDYYIDGDGNQRRNIDIKMQGMDIFKFVVQDARQCLMNFLERTGTTPKIYDYLILHQANVYMIKQLCKRIGFPLEKMPITANRYGNSSSATIPVTIASELKQKIQERDLKLLMSGFGGGLSFSVGSIHLNKNTKLELLDYECR